MSTTVTLNLPDHPEVARLMEMYRALEARYNEQAVMLNRSIRGVLFDESFHDLITSNYPWDAQLPVVTPDVFVKGIMDRANYTLSTISHMRQYASVSGAMRWPWSQEAKIVDDGHEFRYL